MKRSIVAIMLVLTVGGGCGGRDLNKDLKPIDPNTPPPSRADVQGIRVGPEGRERPGTGPAKPL